MPSMATQHDLNTKSGRIAHILDVTENTPSSMARLLGTTPSAIYQWLDGSTKNIKEDLLWKLADKTGFQARWISLGDGPMQIPRGVKHANEVLLAMEPQALYTAVRLIDTLAEPGKNHGTQ